MTDQDPAGHPPAGHPPAGHDLVERGGGDLAHQVAQERRRQLAVEHLLFGALRFVARRHPDLLDELEASLDHLGDSARDGTKDDAAVREVAARILKGLRAGG